MNTPFDSLLKYLMRRPLLVNLILIFIIISAIVSAMRLQRSALPRIDLYNASIMTTYPGASPEDVELNVTRKIEDKLEGISDIKTYTSMSMENFSIITVEIDRTAEDKDQVMDDINNAVDTITDFPEEVSERPTVFEEKSDVWPIYYLSIFTKDYEDTSYLQVAEDIQDELLSLTTVSDIQINGNSDKEIKILLDKDKLKEFEISIDEIIGAIQANKIRLSAGSIESFTAETGIVTLAEFETPEDVEDIIVRINDAGNDITIAEIGRVLPGYEDPSTIQRVNGKPGVELLFYKKGSSDIIVSQREIVKALDEFRQTHEISNNIEFVVTRDESVETRDRLTILYSNAGMGLLLVLILLFIFFNRQLAFWTAMGIPMAIGIAFIAVSFFDVTINRVSLLGLVVVLGMLVDDSIIVAENIFRFRLMGLSAEESALKGVRTVMVPVFATIITTVLAFMPIYFIPGMAMDFAREIPTFVIAMLVGSLIESVLFLPVHLGHSKKKNKDKKEEKPIGEKLLVGMETAYEKILHTLLKRKYISFGLIITGFLVMLFISAKLVTFKMFPIDQATRMYFWGETKQSASLDYTSEAIMPIEKIINSVPEGVIDAYTTTVGKTGQYDIQTLPNLFRFELTLTPIQEREMTAPEIRDFVMQKFEEGNFKEIEKFDWYIDGGGPPEGKPVEISITGNDNEKRIELLNTVSKKMEDIGFTEVDTNYRDGKPELRLTPDNRLLSRSGLSISQVASVIRTAIDGYEVTHMDTPDEQIPFRLVLDKESINKENPLDGLFTINNFGVVIPVENLLKSKLSKTPQSIYHYNGKRTNTITANLPGGISDSEANQLLKNSFKNFELENPGFKFKIEGEAEANMETMTKMLFAIGLAIVAVYFVLVIQFNSLIQPAIVISAIPFGLIGILLAFAIQNMDLSMLALTGIMGYSGVVVNDSLIMVDYINNVRKDNLTCGTTFIENVVCGAKLRFRPIFLTTITTVAGLLPTAYGIFGGLDSFISPMVMAMAWGMIIGTPSVLFIIPLYYSILEDFSNLFRRNKPEDVQATA
jgi:multidrug efflux pump subunit AcrB